MEGGEAFVIEGGYSLSGEITPQGAKNEALQILSAVLLTSDEVTIDNVPDILDVRKLISLLKGLGVKTQKISKSKYKFQADSINMAYVSSKEYLRDAKKIRGSVMLMAPLLARYKKAFLPKPGGDKIGRRRLDTHFLGFQKLGAKFQYDEAENQYYLISKQLKGTDILMDEISVTGTANIVMAAVLAKGQTTIYNAACEPYVQQLCKMLVSMGAQIEGIGSNLLTIQGVDNLSGTRHKILPDMIEIGSFMGMAVLTNSPITIKNAGVAHLGNILPVYKRLGARFKIVGDDIVMGKHDRYSIHSFIDGSIMTVYDSPWPGFTPDLMSIILVMCIQAKGSVLIHQKMFESRLFFVDKLIDMGAQVILCDPHRATVIGMNRQQQLKGISMTSPDIRAGVALLIAALSANGTSTIHNIQQIDRGYQDIDKRLRKLGAKIKRVKSPS
jgi:UDP-N-acetylglucosamine 1-carboxyvinyltransferase